MESSIWHLDPTFYGENPEQAAELVVKGLKDSLGMDYNLWSVLAKLWRELDTTGIRYDNIINDGKYSIVFRHGVEDKQAEFLAALFSRIFGELSHLKVDLLRSTSQVTFRVDPSGCKQY
jgi:hypothetical protein